MRKAEVVGSSPISSSVAGASARVDLCECSVRGDLAIGHGRSTVAQTRSVCARMQRPFWRPSDPTHHRQSRRDRPVAASRGSRLARFGSPPEGGAGCGLLSTEWGFGMGSMRGVAPSQRDLRPCAIIKTLNPPNGGASSGKQPLQAHGRSDPSAAVGARCGAVVVRRSYLKWPRRPGSPAARHRSPRDWQDRDAHRPG